MDDVATLGIRVESSEAVRGFDNVAAAATRATQQAVTARQKIIEVATGINSSSATKSRGEDIRAYGQELDNLRAKYNPLFAAQREYKARLEEINRATRVGALTEKEKATAVMDTKVAFVQQVNSLRGVADAQEKATKSGKQLQTQTGLNRAEMINLSRQIQDVGVSLAGGQNPFLVLIQQGAQIGDIFGSTRGTMSGFLTQIKGMISPTLLWVAGLTALAATTLVLINSWSKFALQIDDVRKVMGNTAEEALKLQSAAQFKGIDRDEFSDAMVQFSRSVREARMDMGPLADLMRLNGKSAQTFEEHLFAVADLVKSATGDFDRQRAILQTSQLPATMQWVRFMEQGSAAIQKATKEAVALGNQDEMIKKAREFDEAWNRGWTNFGNRWRAAVGEMLPTLASIGSKLATTFFLAPLGALAPFAAGVAGTAARRSSEAFPQNFNDRFRGAATPISRINQGFGDLARLPADEQRQIEREQRRIGLLGDLATVEDKVRQKENEIRLGRLSGIPISKEEEARILSTERAVALGTMAIKEQVDAQRIEAATIEMSVGQAAAFRSVQERVLEFRRRGIELTNGQVEALKKEAAVLGDVVQQTALLRHQSDARFERGLLGVTDEDAQIATKLRDVYKDIPSALNSAEAGMLRMNNNIKQTRDLLTEAGAGFAKDFVSGLRNGENAWKSFSNAGMNALNRLADRLIDIASKQLLQQAFGNLLGSGLGNFSSFGSFAGSGFGGSGLPLAPSARGNVFAFARGGVVDMPVMFPMRNGAGLMGEAGPEAVMPLRRGRDGRLGIGGGGSQIIVNNYGNDNVSAERTVSADGNELVRITVGAVRKDFAKGGMDKSMGRFGGSPRAIRRS